MLKKVFGISLLFAKIADFKNKNCFFPIAFTQFHLTQPRTPPTPSHVRTDGIFCRAYLALFASLKSLIFSFRFFFCRLLTWGGGCWEVLSGACACFWELLAWDAPPSTFQKGPSRDCSLFSASKDDVERQNPPSWDWGCLFPTCWPALSIPSCRSAESILHPRCTPTS